MNAEIGQLAVITFESQSHNQYLKREQDQMFYF